VLRDHKNVGTKTMVKTNDYQEFILYKRKSLQLQASFILVKQKHGRVINSV